jgi:ribonuclease HII
VLVSEVWLTQFASFFEGVKDSKQLSAQKREAWLVKMKEARALGMIDFRVSLIGAHTIDTQGITVAIEKGIRSTLRRFNVVPITCNVLLDGGLRAPGVFRRQRTIIRGDETEQVIALASIAAKVARDRLMLRLSRKYPDYGFEEHKGYGTSDHYKHLRQLGPSDIHRLSFLKSL